MGLTPNAGTVSALEAERPTAEGPTAERYAADDRQRRVDEAARADLDDRHDAHSLSALEDLATRDPRLPPQ
ncbi:hypothetical protein [Agrococcus sp. KRD186]|jgi:hypothetical protein|uniref:hypothetical protein n=1 Tax=Agrococcus sp. KRD186 TaxID=2729730 RepID=UPI0019D10E0E|nr:hypothetical protein [Agrococcus sp. KRD186]